MSKCNCCHHTEEKNSKLDLFLTIIGIILLITSIFIKNQYEILSFIGFVISYGCIGYEIILEAIKKLFKKDMFDENFLMVLATIGAFVIGEYFEAVAVILLYKVGEMLQHKAVENSKHKISEVVDLRVNVANLKNKDGIKTITPQDLRVGDVIVVKTGEKVPVDGMLLSDKAQLDMSALTGESKPVTLESKKEILSGTVNIGSVIEIEVTKTYENSTVSKIIDLIENSNQSKSHTEKFITKFAKVYTPIVTIIAILIAFLPLFINITYKEALHRAFTFLVISCPCALVISVPLGFFVGIGACSKKGILVKGSNYLDLLAKTKIVGFDKTGTLTKGCYDVLKIVPITDISKDEIIQKVAMCEYFSNHYIAKSILSYYKEKVDTDKIVYHEEIAGKGILANTNTESLIVGNYNLLKENKIDVEEVKEEGTILYLCVNNICVGYIILSDTLKTDTKDLVKKLKRLGIKKALMLSGDKKEIVTSVSNILEVDEVYSNLLPNDKVNIIKNIKEQNPNEVVIYMGDGINDAPVLARSDIGIAMGRGSDVAIEVSDIVLMNDEPSKLIDAIKIAKNTKKIIKQNIVFAIFIKVLFLAFSSVGLISMWFAIFADVGVALITILNSIRIFFNKNK